MVGVSFAFAKRFEAPIDTGERCFDHPYLLFASAGAFHLDVLDRSWLLPPHRAALIGAGVPIRVWSTAPATSSSVLFAGSTLPGLPLGCQVFRVTPLIAGMLAHAMQWDEASAPLATASVAFFQALAQLAGDAAQAPEQLWFPRATSPDLRRALAHTLARLGERQNFADVARASLVSERTLSRRFADELGMGWIEFVQRARIVRATERLVSGQATVSQIAYELGFSGPSGLARQFRDVMGETPTQYRQRVAGC